MEAHSNGGPLQADVVGQESLTILAQRHRGREMNGVEGAKFYRPHTTCSFEQIACDSQLRNPIQYLRRTNDRFRALSSQRPNEFSDRELAGDEGSTGGTGKFGER